LFQRIFCLAYPLRMFLHSLRPRRAGIMRKQGGFTLVEIAIVLVIIGLLLGGILKGQEMITQAKIKNVIADMSGVSAAMYGYQDRYRALPGDDKNAGPDGGGNPGRWSTATPGNGDGVVNGKWTAASEALNFWDHLRRAGFVSGSGAENPFNAVSGKMGVQTANGVSTTTGVLGDGGSPATSFTALMLCSAGLPDKIAISIDAQMDDGLGKKGTLRGKKASGNPGDIDAAADDYAEDGVSTYVICRIM
jgi:prepilin-type N-terminal cleavage/methylation domain-containing protein